MSGHRAEWVRSRLQGRRGAAIATAALLMFAVAVVMIVANAGGGDAASTASSIASTATTEIKRQDLVEIDTEDGTLGYSGSRDVINHLSGYVTWLPGQGRLIHPNQTLYRVDASPVILMNGSLPAYRTLNSSTSGTDVKQLERNLRALGYDSGHDMTIDGTWTSATTAAVERWQKDHGLDQTGSIELGRIVFQPGVRRVSSLNLSIGGSASGAGSGGTASGTAGSTSGSGSQTGVSASSSQGSSSTGQTASAAGGAVRVRSAVYVTSQSRLKATTASVLRTTVAQDAQNADTTAPTAPTGATGDGGNLPNTPKKPKRKTPKKKAPQKKAPKKKSPKKKPQQRQTSNNGTGSPGAGRSTASASAGTSSGAGGSSGASTTANVIMTTTSRDEAVTVNLDTTKSDLAKLGASVTVEMPSGKTVQGRIIDVGKVATSPSSTSSGSSSSSGTATIQITIRLLSKGTALDQAPVTVRFEQNRVRNALAIPVTALLARSGGTFAVEVVEGPRRRLVSVTAGVYTSGYVQITGAGLQPGMRVTNAAVQ